MTKILVFRNSNLGDYFISVPILRIIREKFPNCHITYMTIKNKKKFILPKKIENKLIVNQFFTYKHKNYKTINGIVHLLKKIRDSKFDKIIYLQQYSNIYRLIRDYCFFSICNIDNKIGFSFFFKNRNYRKDSETILLAKRVFNNLSKQKIQKKIQFNFLKRKKIIKKKYITISTGSVSSPKKWNDDKWISLVNLIRKDFKNLYIVLTGTNNELKLSKKIHKIYKEKILNYSGKTSVLSLFNIIKFSSLHICQDSGSMHIASFYQKKNVCIFNNHDPYGKWFPLNKNTKSYRLKGDINTISPNLVYLGVKNFLNSK